MTPLSNATTNWLIFFFVAFSVLLAINVYLDITGID